MSICHTWVILSICVIISTCHIWVILSICHIWVTRIFQIWVIILIISTFHQFVCAWGVLIGWLSYWYGVASISRLLKIIRLFCKRALWNRRYSAKETYNFKEPTNRSHPLTLYHTATHCNKNSLRQLQRNILQHTATHCNAPRFQQWQNNTLQHTVTHCNTL